MNAKRKKKATSFEDQMLDYAASKENLLLKSDAIDDALFEKLHVNRGLRDRNGKGVLTGLTNISAIISFEQKGEERVPIDGQLWYRGYRIEELVERFSKGRFAYEYLAYLLLFGELPDKAEAKGFFETLVTARKLPTHFVRDVIMKAPGADVMNSMTRSILTLASYDPYAQRTDLTNVIRQSLYLIATFPMLAIYAYHAYNHYENLDSMHIHYPDPEKSIAENILLMLRPDKTFTETEANVLDTALVLHMEHGGGNNSTFTTRVVTSSGSDTYATIAAAMSSLKGPKHGGANLKVMEMMENIRENVRDHKDEDEISWYLTKLVTGEAFDHSGLIYGIGHAVYSISDPRERIFRGFVEKLSSEKGRGDDLHLYQTIERLAPELIAKQRKIYKDVSPNVDFYSGFVYEMLGIPVALFTPIFAIARIVGWSAHRLEELATSSRLIRPAYTSVMEAKEPLK